MSQLDVPNNSAAQQLAGVTSRSATIEVVEDEGTSSASQQQQQQRKGGASSGMAALSSSSNSSSSSRAAQRSSPSKSKGPGGGRTAAHSSMTSSDSAGVLSAALLNDLSTDGDVDVFDGDDSQLMRLRKFLEHAALVSWRARAGWFV